MPTAGRSGFQQSLTGTGTWDVIFDSSLSAHGKNPRGVAFQATTQDVLIRITGGGVHEKGDGTLCEERIIAGALPVERFAFIGDVGLINKIEAKPVVAGGLISWAPVCN